MLIKRIFAVLTLTFVFVLAGCSSAVTSNDIPPNLNGNWSFQQDAMSMKAVVADSKITIELDSDGTSGLYWKGTFMPVAGSTGIVSAGDTAAMKLSLFGSGDKSKTFTYEDGKLNFPFSIMGTTKTIALQKQN